MLLVSFYYVSILFKSSLINKAHFEFLILDTPELVYEFKGISKLATYMYVH